MGRRRGELDEQDQLAEPARRVLEVHDEAVVDLVELLDDAVDLGGPDAHAAAVEGGVRAARDDGGAAFGEPHPVAEAHHARDTCSK